MWPRLQRVRRGFFSNMGIFAKKDEATQPLQEPETDLSLDVQAEDKVPEGVQVAKTEVQAADQVAEDRSAYNCQTCNGDGLVYHAGAFRHERCPNCGGTGKVN
jgi:DnaJ-class molecular chaperone